MEENYETFEEEFGPSRPESPPQKPVRQIRRPERYATRKMREETAPVLHPPPQPVPRALPREPSVPRTMSLRKATSVQNLAQTETPWESVTLNRCLFVAITILVLTSGFQRLHEMLRWQGIAEAEQEAGLTVRRSGTLRHRRQATEPKTSLWEVMFRWLPDLDDEEDGDDDDGEANRGELKRGARARVSSGFRNRPQPEKLTKQRGGKLMNRKAKKVRDDDIKDKRGRGIRARLREGAEEEDEDEENEEEGIPMKNKRMEETKQKKKAQRA